MWLTQRENYHRDTEKKFEFAHYEGGSGHDTKTNVTLGTSEFPGFID